MGVRGWTEPLPGPGVVIPYCMPQVVKGTSPMKFIGFVSSLESFVNVVNYRVNSTGLCVGQPKDKIIKVEMEDLNSLLILYYAVGNAPHKFALIMPNSIARLITWNLTWEPDRPPGADSTYDIRIDRIIFAPQDWSSPRLPTPVEPHQTNVDAAVPLHVIPWIGLGFGI